MGIEKTTEELVTFSFSHKKFLKMLINICLKGPMHTLDAIVTPQV